MRVDANTGQNEITQNQISLLRTTGTNTVAIDYHNAGGTFQAE